MPHSVVLRLTWSNYSFLSTNVFVVNFLTLEKWLAQTP